jgi:hypothetical protein
LSTRKGGQKGSSSFYCAEMPPPEAPDRATGAAIGAMT